MRILLAFSILWLFTLSVQAQKIIYGVVKDTLQSPLPDVTVKLYYTDINSKTLVGFAISDQLGKYRIDFPKIGQTFFIEATSTGHTPILISLERREDTSSIEKNFFLVQSINYIDTVKINYTFKVRVRGDTISFNPGAYALKNENNIEQLISRLPGVEVDNAGKIYFNGSPVTSVLINGDDLFKERYQELTQNASPEIVETIDIIRNYQKDKVLKDKSISGGQVINLKLKEKYNHYTLAHLNAQVDSRKSSLGEIFILHLQSKVKGEVRFITNNIGLSSSQINAAQSNEPILSDTKKNMIHYSPLNYLLQPDQYFARDIPGIYQNFNHTKEFSQNLLFKLPNKWEITTNFNGSTDSLFHRNDIEYVYPNTSKIRRENYSKEMVDILTSNISGSKMEATYSLYFDLKYQYDKRNNFLLTQQTSVPPSSQELKNSKQYFSANLNYNKKINADLLSVTSFSINVENLRQKFKFDSSFLFWVFPADLNLYELNSFYKNKLVQTNYRTIFFLTKGKNESQLELLYQSERLQLKSSLSSVRNNLPVDFNNFINTNKFLGHHYTSKYSFIRTINEKNNIAVVLNNSFKKIKENAIDNDKVYGFWLPDYNLSYNHKPNSLNQVSISLSYARKLPNTYEIFRDSVVDNINSMVTGYSQPYTNKNLSVEVRHILTDLLKRQWLSFTFAKVNFRRDDYIRSFFTNGFFNQHYFTYFPNSVKEFSVLNTSQKLIDRLSLKATTNLSFLHKNLFTLNNNVLQYSQVYFTSCQFGLKSVFKGHFNLEASYALNTQVAKTKSPYTLKTQTSVTVQKLSLYFVPTKSLYMSALFQNIHTRSNSITDYSFLDISVSKKLFKEQFQIQLKGRNLIDKKEFLTNTVTPFYTEQDRIFLIGRQILFSLKYLIK